MAPNYHAAWPPRLESVFNPGSYPSSVQLLFSPRCCVAASVHTYFIIDNTEVYKKIEIVSRF